MNDLTYLFLAFAFIWIGTLGYIFRLAGLRKQLEEKVLKLEKRTASKEPDNG